MDVSRERAITVLILVSEAARKRGSQEVSAGDKSEEFTFSVSHSMKSKVGLLVSGYFSIVDMH